jgi:hypothetical protein
MHKKRYIAKRKIYKYIVKRRYKLSPYTIKQKNDEMSRIIHALSGIKRIKPRIHKISLSHESFDYDSLKKTFNWRRSRKMNGDEARKQPNYTWCADIKVGKRKFSLYSGRKEILFPYYRIETSDSTPDFLLFLSKCFPSATISNIEYTVDFYCKSPEAVADLFCILRRYLWFPRGSATTTQGGPFHGWREPRKMNVVQRVWNRSTKKIRGRLYERGPDKANKIVNGTQYWNHSDCDRVRWEKVIRRGSQPFVRSKISTLNDFLKNPRFAEIVSKEIQFAKFEKSNLLPKYWEDYIQKDSNGSQECFQETHHHFRKLGVNVSQCKVEADGFEALKNKLRKNFKLFDKRWKNRIRRHKKLSKKALLRIL